MFKVGDLVSFNDGVKKSGEVLLVGAGSLLVRVELGRGHDGLARWTEELGWLKDKTYSCWFVSTGIATVVKSKPAFKGNVK